jgi:hypothetical protein
MLTRFAPTLQTLDARDVPAVITVNPLATGYNELVVTGNATDEVVDIRDLGNGTVVATATGAAPVVATNVNQIRVFADAGHDTVRYTLLNDLQPQMFRGTALTHDVAVWLDGSDNDTVPAGNDRFEARLADGVTITDQGRLQISANGGRGNDYLGVTAINVDVAPLGWMKTNIRGGSGDDTIAQLYRGEMDGIMAYRSWGDAGNDVIRQEMAYDVGSTGLIGGLVYGGAGTDSQAFHVVNFQPGMSFTLLENHGDDDAGEVDGLFSSGPVTNFP